MSISFQPSRVPLEAQYKDFVSLRDQKHTMDYICTALKISGIVYFELLLKYKEERKNDTN